jgi:hypothetical protein
MLNNRLKQVGFVVLVWLCATLVRLPNLGRPLSRHHEFSNAAVLRTLSIWEVRGIANCHFAPSMTFQHIGDSPIQLKTGFQDAAQRYYTSLGAMQYWLPYGFNHVFGLANTNRNLLIFNLLLHFLALFGVFRIADLCFSERPFVAVFSTLIYAFAPALLWFHGNVYVHETAFLPFLYLNLYWYLRALRNKNSPFSHLIGYFLNSIVLVLMDWQGIFYLFFIGLHALYCGTEVAQEKSHKNLFSTYFIINASAAICGISLVVFHFSSIVSFDYFIQYIEGRAAERTGSSQTVWQKIGFLKDLCFNYASAYLAILIGLFLIFISNIIQKKSFYNIKIEKNDILKPKFAIFTIILATILTHHLILLEYSGIHDFSTVKSGLLLALLSGFIIEKQFFTKKTKFSIIFILIMACLAQYFYINSIGDIDIKGDRYDTYQAIGSFIQKNATADEVIFVADDRFDAPIEFYAQRNIYNAKDEIAARQKLATTTLKKACFITILKNKSVTISHFIIQ